MSNGFVTYSTGDQKTRDWFHNQWLNWPDRVDAEKTISFKFHMDAIEAYRNINNKYPDMSEELSNCIEHAP